MRQDLVAYPCVKIMYVLNSYQQLRRIVNF